MQAVQRGLRVAVHFTNGPTGSSFKPFGGGGVLQSVLTSHRVHAELIADGYHVNPAYLLDILHRKTENRIVAVTDAMFPAGAQNIDEFSVSGVPGRVSDSGEYLEVLGKENTLFGSVLTMDTAFSNWLTWLTRDMRGIWFDEHLPYETDEAVLMATQLCSRNPANLLGLLNPVSRYLDQSLENYMGALRVGRRADIALFRLRGHEGGYKAEVQSVFVDGRQVFTNGVGH
jgi:N-acetylglucosamine-6-phosphate deacetylase